MATAAVVVFLASVAGGAAAVIALDDDPASDTETLPSSTTIDTTTTTTSTTAAPTTSTTAPSSTTSTTTTVPNGRPCVVRLHGKGGDGADTWIDDGVAYLTPRGNARGWGGRQWLYFPEDNYERAVDVVAEAIEDDDCGPVIINGFSNGGAFAAKLYCRGETFGGRVVRVVIDDPVVDAAVLDCHPAPGVEVTLYWTGALESTAAPGWACENEDWTCEGDHTIGIDTYADALGVTPEQSKHSDHSWYEDAPELSNW